MTAFQLTLSLITGVKAAQAVNQRIHKIFQLLKKNRCKKLDMQSLLSQSKIFWTHTNSTLLGDGQAKATQKLKVSEKKMQEIIPRGIHGWRRLDSIDFTNQMVRNLSDSPSWRPLVFHRLLFFNLAFDSNILFTEATYAQFR